MKKFIAYFSPVALLLSLVIMSFSTVEAQSPIINVWYGDIQEFGNNGEPQVWCNILGNISDDGSITSFTYSLNSGNTVNLSIGPDNRRLENSGDFNIDLDVTDLLSGANTVLISATDNDSNTSTKTVTINYTENNVWPIPYDIDWSTLNNDITKINDVSHVVDGKFELTPDGIRTAEPGYDRLIALGDITSTNYEVLVPVTIHSMPSNAGVGVLLRWKGHTDSPVSCQQPKCGYEPHGAISWFRSNKLEFYQGNNQNFIPVIDVTYMFRTSVETETATGNTIYRIKFWEQGSTEPVAWNIEQTEDASNLQEGCLMLISHKADVTFGDVIVTPGSLSISNVQTQLSNNNTEATVTWTTNQPTTSRIDYGATTAYGSFEENTNLVTSHSITLTGLTADTVYQYKISGENSGMEAVEKTGLVLSTFTSGIQSDDFCGTTLDPVWTFDNPLSDGSYSLTGSGTDDAFLEISVPGGSEHQIYSTNGIQAPNLMQSINNSDFEVEVKFESGVITPQYQQQGILVKESDTRFLRFEFYSRDNSETYLYSQAFNLPAAQTAFVNTGIAAEGITPLYMRVKRLGNQWTLSYSLDGTNYTVGATFFNDMVPTQIGPYAGNAVGGSSPAHTAKIDYFLNLEDPITNEDGCFALQPPVLASIGNQSVVEGNSLLLTLTASDADGNDMDIDFTGTGLPTFAVLNDNDDGTASLDINPLTGDEGTYPVTITVIDSDGLTDEETFDIVVIEPGSGVNNIVSDDFCDNVLDSIWTFNDPLSDGSYLLSGSGTDDALLEISVPMGAHQLWTNGIEAPHIIQPSNDIDFELEVKMESVVNAPQYQEQGILVRQDDYHFLRFEIYSSNTNTKALSAILESATDPNSFPLDSDISVNTDIGALDTAPIYMRVKREVDQWTQSYSFDGQNWTVAGTFSHSMVVSGVGLYSGNGIGTNAPAHVAKFDYFQSLNDAIVTEDGCDAQQSPVLASIGDQSVQEGSNLSLNLMATDEDGNNAAIVFTETDMPGFAQLTNNNDGTASLDIDPLLGDDGTYTMTITVTDADGLMDLETFDIVVTIANPAVSNLVSDDFCVGELDPIWTFNDPIGDGSQTFSGSGTDNAFLEIAVPGGLSHELWEDGINAPHVIQLTNDADFELEVKMESPVNVPQFQEQGILVKQDDYNFLRFEIYSNNSNTTILSAILESATNSFPLNSSIPLNETAGALDIAPVYMKVKREGNLWTQSYSLDGQNWTVAGTFSHSMVVTGVGLYVGNGTGGGSPAHTAQFDYFKNLADPILDEDGCDICEGIAGLVATWNGDVSTDWNDANNWTPNVVPSECAEITIPATTNIPSINGTLSLKYLKLNSGVSLTVPVGTSLIIREDLEMLSNTDTFSGLVVKGSVSVYGDARYHRYTNSELNRGDLIAPPLAGQSWTSFLTSDSNHNADILFSDGVAIPNTTYLFGPFEKGVTGDYLEYIYSDDETLFPSKGYRVATNTPVIEGNGEPLIFTGSIISGPVFREIENDAAGNYPEWNLIGNPYPAYIDVDAFLNHVGSVSGVTNLSLLDTPTAAIYGYNADTNGGIWTITNLVEGPELIAPGQGFFVSSKDPSATLEFTQDMQVVGTANDYVLNRTSTSDFIKLKATTATNSSSISVYFNDNGSSGLDIGRDAAVFGGSVSEFSLYSHLVEDDESLPMVIQTLNSDAINNVIIPLNFNANQGQQIAFSLEDYNLPSSIDVYFEDRLNSDFTLLTSASYTFTANTTISGTGRFFLHFTTSTLSIGEDAFSAIRIYSNQSDRSIVIDGNLQSTTQASVYDLLGRTVLQQELDATLSKNVINANTLSTGIYIVKLEDGKQKLTKKIVIK